jgi:hypothetical protein
MVNYTKALQADPQTIAFQNIDFDTGKPTVIAEYSLTDITYDELMLRLQDDKFAHLSYPLQQNILSYYNNIDSIKLAKDPSGNGKKVYKALDEMKALNLKNSPLPVLDPAMDKQSKENK